METLQVKQYNKEIAQKKWEQCDKTKCIPSMFFFYLDNNYNKRHGFNIERKKGYVAFDKLKACFGMSEEKAIDYFLKRI